MVNFVVAVVSVSFSVHRGLSAPTAPVPVVSPLLGVGVRWWPQSWAHIRSRRIWLEEARCKWCRCCGVAWQPCWPSGQRQASTAT